MKKFWTVLLILPLVSLVLACGGTGEEPAEEMQAEAPAAETAQEAEMPGAEAAAEPTGDERLELTIDGQTMTLEQEWAKVFTARNAIIYIANYDPGENVDKFEGFSGDLSEGQMRVTMNLVPETELETGTYAAGADSGDILNTLSVEYFADGETKQTNLTPREGSVEVTRLSTTGDEFIAGTVDVTSGENGLSGSFFATEF